MGNYILLLNMKTFSAFEKRAILNVAKSINPLNKKLKSIDSKIEQLTQDKQLILSQIESMESTIMPFTENHKSNDLVVSFVNNGVTCYTFKYPETILPPVEIEKENENEFNI